VRTSKANPHSHSILLTIASLSHAHFLSIRSRTQAVGRASSCQLVFLTLQQDTNHLRPHPRLCIRHTRCTSISSYLSTHPLTHTHTYTHTHTHTHTHTRARVILYNSHPSAVNKRYSAAKCYLTNHLADSWPETTKLTRIVREGKSEYM